MDGLLRMCYCLLLFVSIAYFVDTVPPEACFANFRWDDCGQAPTPVMYYWKPGSRCEVGIWRGCLPNLNMFHDEYECINTCIFVARAQQSDYHEIWKETEEPVEVTTVEETTISNFTDYNVTDDVNVTDVTEGQNGTDASESTGNTTDGAEVTTVAKEEE